MLSTPFPETILCDGHSSASGTTAFATCKSLHLNFCRVLPKVSFRYLLVEDKQGTSVVSLFQGNSTTEAQSTTELHREILPLDKLRACNYTRRKLKGRLKTYGDSVTRQDHQWLLSVTR